MKFCPSKKAELLKRYNQRKSSKLEAVQNSFNKGLLMLKITITINPTDGNISMESSSGMTPPLINWALDISKGLLLKQVLHPPSSPLVQASANILEQLSKSNGN